jgi:DUF4097 and DUF4098 domain-containing protein YvlB
MKREDSFPVGDHPELVVTVASSDVVLNQGGGSSIDVELDGKEGDIDQFDITHVGDMVSIQVRKDTGRRWVQPRVRITVTLPAGSDVEVKTASGDIFGSVDTGDLIVATASGDVRFGDISRKAKIKSASGDVSLGDVTGEFEGVSASGDFRIDSISGDATVSTASGDVVIDRASGPTAAKTASGDIIIRDFSGPSATMLSMSGDITIGLAPGMSIDADISTISGSLRNNTMASGKEPTRNVTLRIKTLSGDITLR